MLQKIAKEAAIELSAVIQEMQQTAESKAAEHSMVEGALVYQGYMSAGLKSLMQQLKTGYFFKVKAK